jgi:hypothetical protein
VFVTPAGGGDRHEMPQSENENNFEKAQLFFQVQHTQTLSSCLRLSTINSNLHHIYYNHITFNLYQLLGGMWWPAKCACAHIAAHDD